MQLILQSVGRNLPIRTLGRQSPMIKTCISRSHSGTLRLWPTALKKSLTNHQRQLKQLKKNWTNLSCCQLCLTNRLVPRFLLALKGKIKYKHFLCFVVPFGLSKKAYAQEVVNESSQEPTFPKTPPIPKPKLSLLGQLWETFVTLVRIMQVSIYFAPVILFLPLSYLSRRLENLWWRLFLRIVEWTGPTFVKFGQWASTRRDLFSAEFCDRFSHLHRRVAPHSWFLTKQRLQQAFGKRWREIFVKVEKKPVGSGCIAQVHKGYMHSDLIMDESILAEMSEDQDFYDGIDFSEGLEIVGFGSVYDRSSDTSEYLHGLFGRLWGRPRGTAAEKKPAGSKVQPAENQVKGQPAKDEPSPVHTVASSSSNMNESSTESVHSTSVIEQQHTENRPSTEGSQESSSNPPTTEDGQQASTHQASIEDQSFTASQEEPEKEVSLSPNYGQVDEDTLIPVAIKVVHPGIYRQVYRDLSILKILASVFEFVYPKFKWLSLSECIDEFSTLMTRQMDLRFEAECLEQFAENFENVSQVRFPRVIRPYIRRNILVETFEEGEPISSFVKAEAHEDDKLQKMLALLGVDALLKMVFEDNFVHGDLHPGNILVQNAELFNPEEEAKTYLVDLGDTVIVDVKPVECPVKLVMLDVGITSSLKEEDLDKFRAVFKAVVLGDGERVGQLFLDHSHYQDCQDVEAFKAEMGELVMQAREMTISLGKIQVARLLNDVFGVLSRHRVKMESNFVSIMLAIFVLEGLGRSLDPNLDLLERAKSVLL